MPTNEAVIHALKSGARLVADGHTIFAPEFYTEAGWPEEFVAQFCRVHKSDTRNPKSTIFKDGWVMEEVKGVYNLTFLRAVAHAVGADCTWADQAFGRGTEAGRLCEAILAVKQE